MCYSIIRFRSISDSCSIYSNIRAVHSTCFNTTLPKYYIPLSLPLLCHVYSLLFPWSACIFLLLPVSTVTVDILSITVSLSFSCVSFFLFLLHTCFPNFPPSYLADSSFLLSVCSIKVSFPRSSVSFILCTTQSMNVA